MAIIKKPSAGLAFIQAAAAAMPRTLGDRERIFGMCNLMAQAIRLRFQFDKNDGFALKQFNINTCVGVFRPLDYYSMAVEAGGTYARMWETYYEQKPWIASRAVIQRPAYGEHHHPMEVMENHRIAVGIPMLLPAVEPGDLDLASYDGYQVWHCTSMSNDTVTLCRYKLVDEAHRYRDWQFTRPGGHPARRMTLTRDEWATLNPKVINEVKDAA